MSLSRAVFLLPLLALLGACAALRQPEPRGPLPADASQETREAHRDRYTLGPLGKTVTSLQDREVPNSYLAAYMEASGNSRAARWAKEATWMDTAVSVLVLGAFVQPFLAGASQAPDGIFAMGGVGLMAMADWADLALARPAYQRAADAFREDLDLELGLSPRVYHGEKRMPTQAGWSYALSPGYRSVSRESLRRHFDAPSWELVTDRATQTSLGVARLGSYGFGWGLDLDAANVGYTVNWGNGRKQELALSSYELLLGPSLLIPAGLQSRLSGTLSLGLGYGWLFGRSQLKDAGGAELGFERIGANAPIVGIRARLRLPALTWLSSGIELGYRWARYDSVYVREAHGDLWGAKPGMTWAGQAQAWDFSGAHLGALVEFGSIPWSR